MSAVRCPRFSRKLPHFPFRTVRKHFLYVCRLRDKTKIEIIFHIEQHSCKNSSKLRQKVPENQYWLRTMLFQFGAICLSEKWKRDSLFVPTRFVVKSPFPAFPPLVRCRFRFSGQIPFVAVRTTGRLLRLLWTWPRSARWSCNSFPISTVPFVREQVIDADGCFQ